MANHLVYHFNPDTGEAMVPLHFTEYGPYHTVESMVRIKRAGGKLNMEIHRTHGNNTHIYLDANQTRALTGALLQCLQALETDNGRNPD